jgi:hypothetical protein
MSDSGKRITSESPTGMRSIVRVDNRHKMIVASILVCGLLLCLAAQPHSVYASRHLSDTQRYNDGYSNGSDAANSASVYDVTCDPNNQYASGGGHSSFYCDGWRNGYNDAWNNNNHPTPSVGPIIGQSQSLGAQGQGQGQGNTITCNNVVNCNPSTNQKQDQSGTVNNGQ